MADLKTNNPSLPDKGTEQKGRMSKEAAYAIMGRIALFDARWDDAIEAYNNVIGKVSLFKSGDGSDFEANFRNLFKEENEGCDEVLLSVHFTGPGLKEGSTFGVCWSAPLNAIEASMNLSDDFIVLTDCLLRSLNYLKVVRKREVIPERILTMQDTKTVIHDLKQH